MSRHEASSRLDFRSSQVVQRGAVVDVLHERDAQDEKWGEQNHSPAKWLEILMEEVGEFAKARMEHGYRGDDASKIREELVQVCAVALAMLECCDRNGWAVGQPYDERELALAQAVKLVEGLAKEARAKMSDETPFLRHAVQVIEGLKEGKFFEVCSGCNQPIDPVTCCCGTALSDHDDVHDHVFVPMGCDCGRDR